MPDIHIMHTIIGPNDLDQRVVPNGYIIATYLSVSQVQKAINQFYFIQEILTKYLLRNNKIFEFYIEFILRT